jgi:hypothetical protein
VSTSSVLLLSVCMVYVYIGCPRLLPAAAECALCAALFSAAASFIIGSLQNLKLYKNKYKFQHSFEEYHDHFTLVVAFDSPS